LKNARMRLSCRAVRQHGQRDKTKQQALCTVCMSALDRWLLHVKSDHSNAGQVC
jgi:hypothetical protein